MIHTLLMTFAICADGEALPADYAALRAKAIAEDRPLMVWVGVVRPDIEAVRPDTLHLRCTSFPEAKPPCVIVSRPANGELWRIADLPVNQADQLRPARRRVCGPGGCSYSYSFIY
jgi:hypothetical protein